MKYEDNSVHIGNKNKIKNSSIGKKSQIKNTKNENDESERWYSKLFWKIFIPVVVVVIATAICLWLGLK